MLCLRWFLATGVLMASLAALSGCQPPQPIPPGTDIEPVVTPGSPNTTTDEALVPSSNTTTDEALAPSPDTTGDEALAPDAPSPNTTTDEVVPPAPAADNPTP